MANTQLSGELIDHKEKTKQRERETETERECVGTFNPNVFCNCSMITMHCLS